MRPCASTRCAQTHFCVVLEDDVIWPWFQKGYPQILLVWPEMTRASRGFLFESSLLQTLWISGAKMLASNALLRCGMFEVSWGDWKVPDVLKRFFMFKVEGEECLKWLVYLRIGG